MRLEPLDQRRQSDGAVTDLVGQRRQAELDAFAGVALGLTVERLMLAVLLEQDHRQKARTGEPRPAAAAAGRRAGMDDALARQMLGEGLARGSLAGEGSDRCGPGDSDLGEKVVFRCGRFEIFELELHLIEQPRRAFRPLTVALPVELGDLELEPDDGCGRFTVAGIGDRELGFQGERLGLGGDDRSLQRVDILGKLSAHEPDRSTKIPA